MQEISEQTLTGERALFQVKDVKITSSIFEDGESPLKHSESVEVSGSSFRYKYPLWHSNNVKVRNSVFFELGKSGIWYTNDVEFKGVQIDAPKEFRRCKNVVLEDVIFTDAAETLWTCDGVLLKNVQAKGDYFAMNSSNMKCENVTVYDSVIIGEYLGWNSKSLRFVNCTIESNQGFCYIDGLKLESCTLLNTDLAFEYCSNIDADTHGKIRSIKNPISGKIKADEIGELLLDETKIDPSKNQIICSKIGKTTREITDKNILQ
ncbi:MAG: DUF3737 family protein [Treponema sp.]|nr:DUF3737 family protein [Candidatus Treponema equifaecale]